MTSPVMTLHRVTAMPGRNDAKESPACCSRLGDTEIMTNDSHQISAAVGRKFYFLATFFSNNSLCDSLFGVILGKQMSTNLKMCTLLLSLKYFIIIIIFKVL